MEEDKESGGVRLETYVRFAHFMGGAPSTLLFLVLMLAAQGLGVWTNVWLAMWYYRTQ